jgi:hypothetical protein
MKEGRARAGDVIKRESHQVSNRSLDPRMSQDSETAQHCWRRNTEPISKTRRIFSSLPALSVRRSESETCRGGFDPIDVRAVSSRFTLPPSNLIRLSLYGHREPRSQSSHSSCFTPLRSFTPIHRSGARIAIQALASANPEGMRVIPR